jgi:N-acetylglucosaminyl-diphospho-decaprenol L-rhamnosyltransferase
MELTYCVVNTDGREHLLACLAAIRDTHPAPLEHEVLVLDNGSDDGSAAAAREWCAGAGAFGEAVRVIEQRRREGKAANDSRLLREARGELCLLLNEDSELLPGAPETLLAALRAADGAAAAGARLVAPDGHELDSAWRLPGLATAVASAIFLHRFVVVQSGRAHTRAVGWAQSAAMLVRRSAVDAVGFLDPDFFVYSDETDLCKRLRDSGWRILHVPAATAIHHEQLATDLAAERPRLVEFHRGRDLYLRKHHAAATAAICRWLGAWTYVPRALAAYVLPAHDPARYWLHARLALRPWSAEGLREAAAAYNAGRQRSNGESN